MCLTLGISKGIFDDFVKTYLFESKNFLTNPSKRSLETESKRHELGCFKFAEHLTEFFFSFLIRDARDRGFRMVANRYYWGPRDQQLAY